jgi:hypothetical protein
MVAADVVRTVHRRGLLSRKTHGNQTPMLGFKAANFHQAAGTVPINLTGTTIRSIALTHKHHNLPHLQHRPMVPVTFASIRPMVCAGVPEVRAVRGVLREGCGVFLF